MKYKIQSRNISSVSRFEENEYGWFLVSEYPFYFFRKKDEEEYEVVSLWFTDDIVMVEYHEIGEGYIPKDEKEQYLENISEHMRDNLDFVSISVLEQALNDGFGDIIFSKIIPKEKYKEVNKLLEQLNVFVNIDEDDFC